MAVLFSNPFSSIVLFLLSLLTINGDQGDKTIVACVGDSITFGARLEDPATDSYPAQLQQMLGDQYHVVNLGLGGCTLIRKGQPTVWNMISQIRDVKPDIVVVSLGTNDTCGEGTCGDRRCWEFKDEFYPDYLDLIDTLRSLPSDPRVWICTPSPMVLETPGLSLSRHQGLTLRKPRLQAFIVEIQRVAREKKIELIDLNTPLDHRPELFTEEDGVHPNRAGYRAIAKLIHAGLK